ncbi:MAG: NAD-dependent epimerase/dehydratase family protein [Spartobacteria bacterium]|nr:NAD-dependent epimerase/dehydratase family protein [Spartobacteria bacterium]
MNILVIGGAGFIGSHTVDALCALGHTVTIYDNLSKPVHLKGKPPYLPEIEFIEADVRDKEALKRALHRKDVVFNFAAYQDYLPDFSTFYHVNDVGTALIYEIIVENKLPVRKVVVATSQAVAGEGLYVDSQGKAFAPDIRSEKQLQAGLWDITGPDSLPAKSQETPETFSNPQNQYGISKLCQEKITIHTGARYGVPSVAMRYSIVQGPRQSFYNAYSGACRIFCLSYFFDRPPVIYEDGLQLRDYVNIEDVVAANVRVMNDERADGCVFNVGGGKGYTVLELAEIVRDVFEKDVQPVLPGLYRFGDTRHIISDISSLKRLGWAPLRTPYDSIRAYRNYLLEQSDIEDIMDYAEKKMRSLNVVRPVTKDRAGKWA